MKTEVKDIKIQKEEVDDVCWATKDEIIKMHDENRFHEGHYGMFEEYLKYIGEK